jgi:hypothetical protein
MNPFTIIVLILGIGGGLAAIAGITHSIINKTWRR